MEKGRHRQSAAIAAKLEEIADRDGVSSRRRPLP
jgi:hypothetical protein